MLDASDDLFTISADAAPSKGSVFAENGAGADEGDGPLQVLSINGDSALVGTQITLASSALLRVNADGTYQYDPNGAFDGLSAGQNGADSFTYTVTDVPPFAASLELSALNGANGFKLDGIDGYDFSGGSVSGAGDVNGDGIDDLIIGAWGGGPHGTRSGESYVVFGASTGFAASFELSALNGANGFKLNGVAAGDESGRSVSGAGDVNGDGFDDLIVGAPGGDPNGAYGSGESYVVFGRPVFTAAVDVATASFAIAGVNDAPVAQDDALSTDEKTAISGSVLADNGAGVDADIEGDALTIAAVNGVSASVGTQITLASGALLTLRADGTFDYDPNGGFGALMTGESASDAFSYTLSDGQGGEVAATVTIDIAGVTHAPVARLDLLATSEDGALSGSVFADNGAGADGDLDGDAIAVTRVNNATAAVGQTVALSSGALLTLNADGTFDYDPNGAFDWLTEGESGVDGFSYVLSDGALRSSAGALITIAGINDAPDITTPAAFTVARGETAVGDVAATDAEGDALSYAIGGGADAALFDIDSATGALSFLAPAAAGDYDVVIAASDGAATSIQAIAVAVPHGGTAIGEVVQLSVGTSWQTLTFANTYIDPVVFALAPTLNEMDAVATRFKNVSSTGAEIRLQETKVTYDPATGAFGPNTGAHVDESVTLLVMERGVHTLEDGTVIQVGELQTSKLYVKGFETIAFDEGFATTPSIFSQVQTFNGTDFIISRQRSPDGAGFELTMQEEQADNRNHATETVGWMAIEHGAGVASGIAWQAGSSSQNVNGKLTDVAFNEAFGAAPLLVASLASYNGTDTASPRIGSVTQTKFTAMALEDQSFDVETNHGFEIVDWIAFANAGTIYQGAVVPSFAASVAAPERLVAASGIAVASDAVVTVSFGAQFDHPVVIATLSSMADGAAAIARISNVTEFGFDLALQTPGGDAHAAEAVSWMVVEAGSWMLADGTVLQAGLTDLGSTTRQGFASVAFDVGFADGPAVLSQVQTMGDGAFVKTRMQGVDGAGFEVALEEAEADSWGGHGLETVGWIAVDIGLASDADGFVFEAGTIDASHRFASAEFAGSFDVAPGVLAGMTSYNGADTGAARIGAITDAGFDVQVQEDLTLDAELSHALESVHWIAVNEGDIWGGMLV